MSSQSELKVHNLFQLAKDALADGETERAGILSQQAIDIMEIESLRSELARSKLAEEQYKSAWDALCKLNKFFNTPAVVTTKTPEIGFVDHVISRFESLRSELARVTAERDALKAPEGWLLVPFNPPESQWSGLARDIMMWLDLADRKTPRTLLRHLELCGTEISAWLRNEPEMQYLDHVISKGTRVVILYKAMLAAAPKPEV